jgi:hypothetical protein
MALAERVIQAPWIADVSRELLRLLDYEPNWNSYGALAVSPSAIGYAWALMDSTMER